MDGKLELGNDRKNGGAVMDKLLRKIAQIISIFSPTILSWLLAIRRIYIVYHQHHGFYPSIIFPIRFTEKMQWRKLFDLNPLYSILCDKVAVRDFIKQRGGPELLVPLLWSGDDPNAIPFDAIAPPYIVKSSHASEHTIIVENEALLDEHAIRDTARAWLAWNHGRALDEPGYFHVPQALLIERLLLKKDGSPPREHKVFVFDGVVRVIQTITVSATDRARFVSHHTPDWIELPWRIRTTRPSHSLNPPCQLDKIIEVAECLGEGFDHVRVDLYECDDRIYAGEMTPYSHSGLLPITPHSADFVLGNYWNVRLMRLRALWAVLVREREIRRPADLRVRTDDFRCVLGIGGVQPP